MEPESCFPPDAEVAAPVWDEHKFVAGRLSNQEHIRFWEEMILIGHPDKDKLFEAMCGMRPHRYFKRYRGRFAGQYYGCDKTPSRVLCKNGPTELTKLCALGVCFALN